MLRSHFVGISTHPTTVCLSHSAGPSVVQLRYLPETVASTRQTHRKQYQATPRRSWEPHQRIEGVSLVSKMSRQQKQFVPLEEHSDLLQQCSHRPCLTVPEQALLEPSRKEIIEDRAKNQPLVVVRHVHVSNHIEVSQESRRNVGPGRKKWDVLGGWLTALSKGKSFINKHEE